jgi:hypothetical protein
VSVFNFTGAASGRMVITPVQPYIRPACTGATNCTLWGLCINGIKTCDSSGYSLLPSGNCSGTIPAPTSACSVSESARSASGYAWSDNVGYISFSGDINSVQSVVTTCTPDSVLTQTLACPTGQTGSITQTRTSTCSAGASSPTTSDWATTSNTCVTPVTCTPDSPLVQTRSCSILYPEGSTYTGTYILSRTSTCPAGASAPITSDWTFTITCSPICQTDSLTQTISATCPAGTRGTLTQTRTSVCVGTNPTPITSAWVTTDSTGCRATGHGQLF